MNMPLEETLLSTARKLRDPVARSGFLIKACGDDDALRARIEALLHSEPAGALSLSAADTARPAPLETVGDTIDRYRLLQQIGEDGCGVTYMAEQLEPVHRKVALKI